MKLTSIDHEVLMDCPACGKPLAARVAYEVILEGEGRADGKRVANVSRVGVSLSHDCMPVAKRRTA